MKQSKFVISTRRDTILTYLHNHGTAKVDELSVLCGVSPLTIRRDLDALEQSNMVIRNFGGVQLMPLSGGITPFEKKEIDHPAEKAAIAKAAGAFIGDGSTVFINSGTTVLQVLKSITSQDVTVVTNNALAYQYEEQMHGTIICTGGTYTKLTRSYVGELAADLVNKVYADICILGVNGIDSVRGVTTAILQETMINQNMVNRCLRPVIVVADGSKIGKTFSFASLDLHQVNILITDASADPNELEKFRNVGIDVRIESL